MYPIIRNALSSWLICSLSLCLPIAVNPAVGQIVPDNTLPLNSEVTPTGNINTEINGGTVAGSNLFHSFQEFSIPTGGTTLFNNPLNIQNILTRVTGTSVSNIDGLLQARGNANLFFLNPNGVVFGRNAGLDIGGSFLSSTANSIKFADGSEFSAVNPQRTSLLSVNVPLGLQFPEATTNIINRANLQVSQSKTIALVGGGVTLEGGQLTAPQGRIEVGSVNNGLVSLNPVTDGWTLEYKGINNFGNIQLLSGSSVNSNGSVRVQGGRVTLTDGSKIIATTSENQNGGEIFIRAKDLTVTNVSEISAQTLDEGNAGVINVQADNVEVSGANSDGSKFSTIAATSKGSGNSGSININTNRLIAKDGADVSVTTFNSGKGGNLSVNASESIQLTGARTSTSGETFSRSGLFAATEGTGNGGDITINTPKLQVADGARVSVSTRGKGQSDIPGGSGGSLQVNAGEIEVSGNSLDGRFISGLFALSGEERPGLNPNVATGQGGDIKIETGKLTIRSGAQVSAATEGIGQGGNISVTADAIDISGASRQFSTLAATSRSIGNSGNITINSRNLKVSDGADVSVSAFGNGKSGELNVQVSESIELIGANVIPRDDRSDDNFSRSGLFAATEGTQDGGSLSVNTRRLLVKDGARISASTRGKGETNISGGRGGNLNINASSSVELSGLVRVTLKRNNQIQTLTFPSGLFALSGEDRPDNLSAKDATGIGGNLEVSTGLLNIRDGAELSVSAGGSGTAGRLQVQAQSVKLQDGAIRGATVVGTGANTTLQIRDSLQLRGNSQISTVAGSNSNGGNITIEAGAIAILENSSIRANAGRQGGNVRITTQGLFAFPSAITATSELGTQFNGIIEINLPDVDSNQELTEPPRTFDQENQVATACIGKVGKNRNQFIITGRGGLPPSPEEPLTSEVVRVLTSPLENSSIDKQHLTTSDKKYPRPATGWGVNSKGEILLTSNTGSKAYQTQLPTPNCHAR